MYRTFKDLSKRKEEISVNRGLGILGTIVVVLIILWLLNVI